MYVSYIFILSSIGLGLCGLDSYECLCVWVDYIKDLITNGSNAQVPIPWLR
jgi:hypothetical protein